MACRIHAAAASCTAATTTASSSSAATGCVRCSGTGNSANVKPHDQVPLEIDGCESLVSVLNHYRRCPGSLLSKSVCRSASATNADECVDREVYQMKYVTH